MESKKTEMQIFEDFRRRIRDDNLDVSTGIFVMSELHEKMMLHAKEFSRYIISSLKENDNYLGTVGFVTESGVCEFGELICGEDEQDNLDIYSTGSKTVDELYEQFSKTFE